LLLSGPARCVKPWAAACASGKYSERAIVYLQEFAGVLEKGYALRRKLHGPRRPLDEPAAKPFFEALQLQADRGLRRPHGFSRAREATKLGDSYESLDGIQVEGRSIISSAYH
jgi:hypothetical protein